MIEQAVSNARILTPVDSSVIEDIEYNYSTSRLTVKFNSGSVWQYEEVPVDVWNHLQTAESVGATYNLLVRNKFTGYKLNSMS